MPSQTLNVPATNTRGTSSSYAGGPAFLFLEGTFNSATLQPQIKLSGSSTWHNLVDVRGNSTAKTADGYTEIYAPEGVDIAINVTGGGGSVSVTATLEYAQTNVQDQAQNPA